MSRAATSRLGPIYRAGALIAVGASLCGIGRASAAASYWTVHAGIARSELKAQAQPAGVRNGSILRPEVGIGAGLRFASRFDGETTVVFAGRGGEGTVSSVRESVSLDYLALRITGRTTFGRGRVSAFVEGGAEAAALLRARDRVEVAGRGAEADASRLFRDGDAAVRSGAGVSVRSRGREIFLSGTASVGLRNVSAAVNRSTAAVHTRAITVSVGVRTGGRDGMRAGGRDGRRRGGRGDPDRPGPGWVEGFSNHGLGRLGRRYGEAGCRPGGSLSPPFRASSSLSVARPGRAGGSPIPGRGRNDAALGIRH